MRTRSRLFREAESGQQNEQWEKGVVFATDVAVSVGRYPENEVGKCQYHEAPEEHQTPEPVKTRATAVEAIARIVICADHSHSVYGGQIDGPQDPVLASQRRGPP